MKLQRVNTDHKAIFIPTYIGSVMYAAMKSDTENVGIKVAKPLKKAVHGQLSGERSKTTGTY